MCDGCPKPPPPPTDPYGSATTPCQPCKDKVPEPQLEKGLPILPVRYALIPSFLRLRPDPSYGTIKTLKQFADKPTPGHKYTLRILRRGFVHVYLGTAGKWQIYEVDERGYLRRLTNLDASEQRSNRSLAPDPTEEEHDVAASFIYVPVRYAKIWIAFSETHWTNAVRSAMEKNPGARMQALDINALAAAPDSHPDAFELNENASRLSALVDEYAASEDEYIQRTTYKHYNFTTEKDENVRWDSVFGLHGRGGQSVSLGSYAKAYADNVKASRKQERRVPVVALVDPVGMLKEANQTRLHFVAAKQSYCESVMRPLIVAQSINGLEKIIRESTFRRIEEEEKKQGMPDVQTHYIPAGMVVVGVGSYTDTRAERARAEADRVWNRLAERLRPGEKEAFEAKHNENIKLFDAWILGGDSTWATWAEDLAWLTWFDDYDIAVGAKRAELLENNAACLAGGVVGVKSAAVWKKWLSAKPFDAMNPIYRALFGDRKSLTDFLTPGEDYALNKTDKLYDMLKSLVGSGEAKLAAEATKIAATDVGLAIAGAIAELGDEVSALSRKIAIRAQQGMMMLYQGVEVTMLKVQTTVGEYHRWLSEIAFNRMRSVSREAGGLLKRGERVVKSAVVGGIMSIRDPKIRDQVIDVIVWTFDTVDDIKARLDEFDNNASTTTSRVRGTLDDAAEEVMHTIQLASATLNREAARLLGAVEGRLTLATSRLRGFVDTMHKGVLRFAGSGDVLLAAGAVIFQGWAISEGLKEVDSKLGELGGEAKLGLMSAGIGFFSAVTELTGATMTALSSKLGLKVGQKLGEKFGEQSIEVFGKLLTKKVAPWIAVFASIVDSIQAAFAATRTYRKGDRDAFRWYTAASLLFAISAGFGAYALAVGSLSLLGPFGIALAFVALGVIALWWAMTAEDTVAEIWMDRCYFGRGERSEKPWTDAQAVEEIEHLNAIYVGLGAQVGFNDNILGDSGLLSDYDTVKVQIKLGDYDANRSAYEWSLWIHHKDGRKFRVMSGQAGRSNEPQPIVSMVNDGNHSSDGSEIWIKRRVYDRSMEKTTLTIQASADVLTKYFSKVSLEAQYWLDQVDQAAVARVLIEESD